MFGFAAIGAFIGALIMQVGALSDGRIFTVPTFTLVGLLCLAVHLSTPWGHRAGT